MFKSIRNTLKEGVCLKGATLAIMFCAFWLLFFIYIIPETRELIDWIQISSFKYDISPLLETNETVDDWINSEHRSIEGISGSGKYYFRESKHIALEASAFLNEDSGVVYTGKGKVFKNFEQFAPVLFKWQCEFDAEKRLLYSYMAEEHFEEWKEFVRSKIREHPNYEIWFSQVFNLVMKWEYNKYH